MTRRRWRTLLVAAAVAVVAAVGYWAVEIRTRTGAERVKHMVDWGESCPDVEVERSVDHLEYLRDWSEAEERAIVSCYLVSDVVYARFRNAAEASRVVAASPPVVRMCDFPHKGSEVTKGYDRARGGPAFRARCRRRHGRVDEWTERYCLAGAEVVVDGLDDDPEFRKLCRELDGSLVRPPRSVLDL